MATKDQYLVLNNKKNGITNDQFQNLNLNQGHQHFVGDTVSSRGGIYDSKKVQNYIEERQRKECSLWNKKDLNSRRLLNNFGQQEIEKEKSNIGSSSTLSLHITAYENSNITASSTDSNTTLKDTKKIINGFELPRQQENNPSTPEIMQFKSSKKMANQASISKTQATTNSDRTEAKSQSRNGKEAAVSRKNAPSTKAKNVQEPSKIPATKKVQENKKLPPAGDAGPKGIRERRFNYNSQYFSLTPNQMFYLPISMVNQASPELTALIEKTNEMHALIKKKEYLSSGTYGSVSLCKIKGIKPIFVHKTLKKIRENADEINAELNVYSQINSPLFPKLLYAGIYEKTYCIISEFASGGDLDQNNHKIAVADVRFIAYELFLAIRCLHEIKLSHGDLKGNNVALTADGHVKLLDCGLSRNIETPTVLPTTPFMAPEVRARRPAGASADFFSYGCVLIGLMQKDVDAYDLNKPSGDPMADDFIKTCFITNEEIRMKRVIEHQYLKISNPHPTYLPGPLKIQKRQPPAEETEHPDITFCISDESFDTILKNSLIRFPSSKNFSSFK